MSPEPASAPAHGAGCFLAVVGPSGAGKDTLLRGAAARLCGDARIVFARRVITRTADAGAEDHLAMSPDAFDAADAAGAFCLSWRAHGLAYGLTRDLEDRVEAGCTVLANVSRSAIATAGARFARLGVIEVTAPRSVLVARLLARGREAPEAIAHRLDRPVAPLPDLEAGRHIRIDNAGPVEDGARQLVAAIERWSQDARRVAAGP